jgi:AraC family transcriptional regulator of adaptative response/methylated-DNA-[protein]-cysteine methyltransferase
MNTDLIQASEDYQRIAQAIHYLETHYQEQPELNEIAASIGLSEYHFQRLFTRWAGISPKRFLQFLTKEGAKELLQRSSVLDSAYNVGLSGPGRLHDLLIATEAVTPGEFKTRGQGLTIRYGIHPTLFGNALIGITERGICHLSFLDAQTGEAPLALQRAWPKAALTEDRRATGQILAEIFSPQKPAAPVSLLISGTNFQLKVWEALLAIPQGQVSTYGQIAAQIGSPGASRAVGTAIGQNPIAFLIPCHRVIRKMGEFGNYRWGVVRKKSILGWESAQNDNRIISQ